MTDHYEELDRILIYSNKSLIKSIVKINNGKQVHTVAVRLIPESVNNPIIVKSRATNDIVPHSYRSSASQLAKISIKEKEYIGTIISVSDERIMFEDYDTKKIKAIRKYDSYEYLEQDRILSFDHIDGDDGVYDLSYLSSSITWEPEYHIYLSRDMATEERLTLIIRGVISSKLTKDFYNYPESMSEYITLIADHVAQPGRHRMDQRTASYESLEPINHEPSDEDEYINKDYPEYTVSYDIPLVNTDNNIILSDHELIGRKIYLHHVETNKNLFGYRFDTPVYLPPGRTYIMNEDDVYLGKTNFKSTVEGEEVEMIIGPTQLVGIKSITMRSSKIIETPDEDHDINQSDTNIRTIETSDEDHNINQSESPLGGGRGTNIKTIKHKEITINVQNTIKNMTGGEINITLRLYIGKSTVLSIIPKPEDSDIIIKDGHIDYDLIISDETTTSTSVDFVVVISD